MGLITSWSFSRLDAYSRCPYTIRLVADKAPQLKEDEPNRGTQIHKLAELFVTGELETLPKQLSKLAPQFEEARAAYLDGTCHAEQPWGFKKDWSPCGWFDDDIWLRVKTDLYFEHPGETSAEVVDVKTGRSWGNEVRHAQQNILYAIAAFQRDPDLETVETTHYYTDEGKVKHKVHVQNANFERQFERFMERAHTMLNDEDPTPRPNKQTCRFCPWGPSNGSGACEYGVPHD